MFTGAALRAASFDIAETKPASRLGYFAVFLILGEALRAFMIVKSVWSRDPHLGQGRWEGSFAPDSKMAV